MTNDGDELTTEVLNVEYAVADLDLFNTHILVKHGPPQK